MLFVLTRPWQAEMQPLIAAMDPEDIAPSMVTKSKRRRKAQPVLEAEVVEEKVEDVLADTSTLILDSLLVSEEPVIPLSSKKKRGRPRKVDESEHMFNATGTSVHSPLILQMWM
jgi:hypothetical protein